MGFLPRKKPSAQLWKHDLSVDTIGFKILGVLGSRRKKGVVEKGEREVDFYLSSYFWPFRCSCVVFIQLYSFFCNTLLIFLSFFERQEWISSRSVLISEALRAQNVARLVMTLQEYKGSCQNVRFCPKNCSIILAYIGIKRPEIKVLNYQRH